MSNGRWYTDKVALGFSIAILVIAALIVTTWQVARSASDASRWVAHTQSALNVLSRLRTEALDIELMSQNYRLTHDPALLVQRNASIAAREGELRRLRQLIGDNPLQVQRFAALRAVIDERVAIARRIEEITKAQGAEAASVYVATAPLEATRRRMHGVLQEMEQEETRLLAQRSAREAGANRRVLFADIAVAVALSMLLLTIYRVIRRQEHAAEATRLALAANEERLFTTLNSIGDAVLATDTEGRVVDMNPVAERLTGWPLAEARGRLIVEVFRLIHEETRAPAQIPLEQAPAADGTQEPQSHIALIARDGSEIPIADSAAPIRDAGNRPTGTVLVFRDETAARQAQRTAREHQDLLEQRVQERTAQMRDSQEHLQSIINNVPALIAFVDPGQRYVYANKRYEDRFAYGCPRLAGMTVREVLGEERYAIAAPMIARALSGEDIRYDWQPFPGTWQEIHYLPRRDAAGAIAGYYVLGTDITGRKTAEQEIRSLNTQLAEHIRNLEHTSRALRTLSAGNRSLLHASDEAHLLESMCQAIVQAGGYRMACVWYCGDEPHSLLVPMAQSGHQGGFAEVQSIAAAGGGDPDADTAVAVAVRSGAPGIVRNIHEDPAYAAWRRYMPLYGCCVASPLRIDGKTIGALAIYSDRNDSMSDEEVALLTESADDLAFGIAVFRARAAMYRLTFCDDVTGLPNGVKFAQLVAASIEQVDAGAPGFSLLQANMERLREINEGLGAASGDELLRQFAQRLCSTAPPTATVARLRGKEFAVLVPESGVDEAVALAQRLELALEKPFAIAGLHMDVAAKLGIAQYPDHGGSAQDLLRHIDIAVGQARRLGTRHALFDPSYRERQAMRMTMVGELRHAIEADQLSLYLQPKVDMKSGRIVGAEGLLRWIHPTRGIIPPSDFIPLAETSLLIQPLTDWVVRTALELRAAWHAAGSALPIAVNLSAPNFRDEGLVQRIRALQQSLGARPGMLEIELTESMLMDEAQHALEVLHALRALDIPLYIDDFGTGYSSLSYLQQMPVDYIKTDQSFVRHMIEREESATIVRATIELAHELRRKVVAEGVETRDQWDRLLEYGCDFAQGYLIAPSMPAASFPGWVEQYASRLQ